VTEHPRWVPREGLVADLRHAIARAPRDTAEDRFEAWAWRAMLDEHGAALLTRHAAPSHVTASAVVLSPDGLLTCLVLHRRLGLWVQPGGHLEADDMTLPLAAAREVEEETSLTGELLPDVVALSRHRAPCRPGVVDWHLDVQHVLVASGGPGILGVSDGGPVFTAGPLAYVSPESRQVAWWPVGELPPALAPGVAPLVARAAARLAERQEAGSL
jgi:8-oxo-dGTP pyrophosphatase MutT (NUDIX family)